MEHGDGDGVTTSKLIYEDKQERKAENVEIRSRLSMVV
jgi:hypothetical protein